MSENIWNVTIYLSVMYLIRVIWNTSCITWNISDNAAYGQIIIWNTGSIICNINLFRKKWEIILAKQLIVCPLFWFWSLIVMTMLLKMWLKINCILWCRKYKCLGWNTLTRCIFSALLATSVCKLREINFKTMTLKYLQYVLIYCNVFCNAENINI